MVVAKRTGLPVIRFSIGMGPVIWKRDAFGLEWALSAIPFGGYVLFDGEDPDYESAPPSARILTSLAGPGANVLAAIVLYIGASSIGGGSLAIMDGLERTWLATTQTFDVVVQLFTGQVGIKDLAGPVHMVSIGSSLADEPTRFLSYLGFISINLAVLNMLPIPILDGGQILLVLAQAVSGKPLPERAQTVVLAGSSLLVFGVIVWVVFQDVFRLIS